MAAAALIALPIVWHHATEIAVHADALVAGEAPETSNTLGPPVSLDLGRWQVTFAPARGFHETSRNDSRGNGATNGEPVARPTGVISPVPGLATAAFAPEGGTAVLQLSLWPSSIDSLKPAMKAGDLEQVATREGRPVYAQQVAGGWVAVVWAPNAASTLWLTGREVPQSTLLSVLETTQVEDGGK